MKKTNKLAYLIKEIERNQNIGYESSREGFRMILKNEIKARWVNFGAFFASMATKGPTPDEIKGLIDAVMSFENYDPYKIKIKTEDPIYTICGSGKDDFKTFNISTTASFIASCFDVCIAKNGSQATSQSTGSVDILRELGLNMDCSHSKMCNIAKDNGIGFFIIENEIKKYDKIYGGKFFFTHPLSYGFPALIIPVNIDGVVYGVADKDTELTAKVLKDFGLENSMVVSNQIKENIFIDELSIFGKNKFSIIKEDRIETKERDFSDLSSGNFSPEDIASSSKRKNVIKMLSVLKGEEEGAMTDIACLNSGAILYVAGKVNSLEEGFFKSKQKVEIGAPFKKLEALISKSGGDLEKLESVKGKAKKCT